jgi:hypothetical protein
MPEKFKALATVSAWTLFVIGWISLIAGYFHLAGIYLGAQFAEVPAGLPPVWCPLVGGFVCLTLSVVVMRLRQAME